MKKIKNSIYSAIANVQTAFPSVFTKEDVVSILEGLHTDIDSDEENETVSAPTLDEEAIDQIAKEVADELGGNSTKPFGNWVQLSLSFDFDGQGRLLREPFPFTGRTDSAELDEDRIKRAVKDAIENYIETLTEEEG